MYYINIGMPGIIVCLCLVMRDRTVGCSDSGHAEGILRCCKYPVNSFLTEIVRIIVAFFKNVVYLVFLMADLVVLVNRFQCYVAKP